MRALCCVVRFWAVWFCRQGRDVSEYDASSTLCPEYISNIVVINFST